MSGNNINNGNLGNPFQPSPKSNSSQTPGSPNANDPAASTTPATPTPVQASQSQLTPSSVLTFLAGSQPRLPFSSPSIAKSVDQFSSTLSPETYNAISQLLTQAYTQEFGKAPTPQQQQFLTDTYMDNYVIGTPTIATTS